MANKHYRFQHGNSELYTARIFELAKLKKKKDIERKKARYMDTAISESQQGTFSTPNDATQETGTDSNVQTRIAIDRDDEVSSVPLGNAGVINRYPLDKFWKRMVHLASFTVSPTLTGAMNQFILHPFTLYTSSSPVRAKLLNYSRARFNLKLTFIVSGNRYIAGSYIVSNQPYSRHNQNLQCALDSFDGTFSIATMKSNMYLSQSPEHKTLLPGMEDNNFEMVLPFIAPKSYTDLYNDDTVISPGVPFENMDELSTLVIQSISPLMTDDTNFATPMTIAIYANAEEMEFQTITATEMIISESEAVDFSTKPLSSLANVVEQVAGVTSQIPILSGVSKTVGTVASKVGRFARFFGFSKPVSLEPERRVKLCSVGTMATTEGVDMSNRMTLTMNQSVGIPNYDVSPQPDMMSIVALSEVETYLWTFPWDNSAIPNETNLFTSFVSPMQYITDSIYTQFTPACFLSNYFSHWRADIIYRFEIVAPVAARGQLAVWFDPNVPNASLIASQTLDLIRQPIAILNIEEGKNFSIKCGYINGRLVSNCFFSGDYPDTTLPAMHNPSDFEDRKDFVSGQLGVTPFTLLQPKSDSPIYINVYTRCSNLHFYGPISSNPNKFYIPKIVSESGREFQEFSYDMKEDMVDLYGCPSSSGVNEQVFGEEVISLRALIKRFEDYGISTSAANLVYPVYPGVACDSTTNFISQYNGASTAEFNQFNERSTLFDSFSRMYLFQKGGFRWKVASDIISVKVTHASCVFADFVLTPQLTDVTTGDRSIQYYNSREGFPEFEIPYYSNNLFMPVYNQSGYVAKFFDTARQPCWYMTTVTLGGFTYTLYGAAADDFSFIRFQGAPPMKFNQ